MIFVHLGAGAGDKDEGALFRCGFTEFIKKKYSSDSKIFVVESNPLNIKKLNFCYKDFKNVQIINTAISKNNSNKLKMYYAEDDAPHFQVCSSDIKHVKKHYPKSKIKNFDIKSISINDFFKKYIHDNIDYLSIDIEGSDYETIMSINFEKYNIRNISIEYLHLNKLEKKNLINHLIKKGYSYCGFGYDHNNFDYLFRKKKIFWNILLSKVLHQLKEKYYPFLNFFILDKEKL
tara:strand:- start:116 stop:814 length:699 start_codon:yes stop_codon:yes gene_type:complete